MPKPRTTEDDSVAFIRLLFKSSAEEQLAYRWASRLAKLLGPRVMQLRPNTTLAELLKSRLATEVVGGHLNGAPGKTHTKCSIVGV